MNFTLKMSHVSIHARTTKIDVSVLVIFDK